ncbi:traB domain-containing protein-like [Saccostrea echinata]|uniref:traB domain-containing protein-like n=1 Tax=Saccostrea echinata TaxID=191078 RepID=UPI002A810DC6|nr:traB domain-containing protein-like [Saccostrea echinata]
MNDDQQENSTPLKDEKASGDHKQEGKIPATQELRNVIQEDPSSEIEDEWSVHDETYETISGEESDIEDNVDPYPVRNREENPDLPETCSVLETKEGSKVYLIGTAHFSAESLNDVSKVIQATEPDVVSVELCMDRIKILQLDEETVLREAKDMNFQKIKTSIAQNGLIQGLFNIMLLNISARLTKELGMAPGGEFRQAYKEAQKIPRCKLHLGDRPIQITLQRAFALLSLWQLVKFIWHAWNFDEPISKEDVEKFKGKDLLEQLLAEMTTEFPGLSQVVIEERDTFLAHSLKMAAEPIRAPSEPKGYIPSVVVGVVGIGHVAGIKANWEQEKYDINEIMVVPEVSKVRKLLKYAFRFSFYGVLCYGCYKLYRITVPLLT